MQAGQHLYRTNSHVGAFDAVLAAAALSAGARNLVSADRAFAQVPRLAHVFPDEAGVRALSA